MSQPLELGMRSDQGQVVERHLRNLPRFFCVGISPKSHVENDDPTSPTRSKASEFLLLAKPAAPDAEDRSPHPAPATLDRSAAGVSAHSLPNQGKRA